MILFHKLNELPHLVWFSLTLLILNVNKFTDVGVLENVMAARDAGQSEPKRCDEALHVIEADVR